MYVVDDDKIYHFLIKKLLKKNNIDINPCFFENGQEAINGLKSKINNNESTPDLILLDINMPVLDGWQFLEEFKNIKSFIKNEIAIYIISSSDNLTDKNRAKDFDEEIKDYYLKPVTGDAIKTIFAV
jgi:two-component system chemotaxis response regulator CheY